MNEYPIQPWLNGVIVKRGGRYAYRMGNQVSQNYMTITALQKGEGTKSSDEKEPTIRKGTSKTTRGNRARNSSRPATSDEPTSASDRPADKSQ